MAYNPKEMHRNTVDLPRKTIQKDVDKLAEKEDRSVGSMLRILIIEAIEARKSK